MIRSEIKVYGLKGNLYFPTFERKNYMPEKNRFSWFEKNPLHNAMQFYINNL